MIQYMQRTGFLLYDIAGLNSANRPRSVNEFNGIFVRHDLALWDVSNFLPSDAPVSEL